MDATWVGTSLGKIWAINVAMAIEKLSTASWGGGAVGHFEVDHVCLESCKGFISVRWIEGAEDFVASVVIVSS